MPTVANTPPFRAISAFEETVTWRNKERDKPFGAADFYDDTRKVTARMRQWSDAPDSPQPPWLGVPPQGTEAQLVRRLELGAKGTTRVSRHDGTLLQRLPRAISLAQSEVVFSLQGRKIVAAVQAHAAMLPEPHRAAAKAALPYQLVGTLALVGAGALGVCACIFAATLGASIVVGLLGVAVLLVYAGIRAWQTATICAQASERRLQAKKQESQLLGEMMRLEELLRADRAHHDSTPAALEALWNELANADLLPQGWFLCALDIARKLAALQLEAAKTSDAPSAMTPVVQLAAEELFAKIAAGETFGIAETAIDEEICRATSLGLDSLANHCLDDARVLKLKRYVLEGTLEPTLPEQSQPAT